MFDAAGIEALAPGDRERRVWDEALKGFGVRVRPSGTKSWIVNASTTGPDGKVRSRRITLGQCGEMSLEEARTQARKLLGAGDAAVESLPAAGMADRAARDRAPKSATAAGRAAAAVETDEDADRPAGDPVAGLTKTLDGIRGGVDRIEAWSARTDAQMELLSDAVAQASAMDRRRRRLRLTAVVLATALATAAVGLAGGAFVQSRYPVLPQAGPTPVWPNHIRELFLPRDDPTLGWKDYFWDHYGQAFKDCFTRAKAGESGRIDCTIEVRAR